MLKRSVSEVDCLRRIISGEDAWGEFWDLFGYIIEIEINRFFGNNQGVLDDIYQDLVVKLINQDCKIICNHLATNRSTGFGALVKRITHNMLIDVWRKRKRQGVLEFFDGGQLQVNLSVVDNNPARQYQNERQLIDILMSVTGNKQDSEAFRILFLRFVDGESVKFIAGKLNMKEDTVRHRIDYYLMKLKREHGEVPTVKDDD